MFVLTVCTYLYSFLQMETGIMWHVYFSLEDYVFRVLSLSFVSKPELELALGLLAAHLNVLWCWLSFCLKSDAVVFWGVLWGDFCNSIKFVDKSLFKIYQWRIGLPWLTFLLNKLGNLLGCKSGPTWICGLLPFLRLCLSLSGCNTRLRFLLSCSCGFGLGFNVGFIPWLWTFLIEFDFGQYLFLYCLRSS